ncbi:MAG: UDP-N-acetylglucosamine 2-epimerase (non-hydrolyzing) [Bacteroidales bacterium]|nr:UDP-N-acetylglucosamine 2-epimerase (non-hydrolyzing) [Bacteroidales bacterium]
MRLTLIAGARPNFIKIAPIIEAIARYRVQGAEGRDIKYRLVHTGQHYDRKMSDTFFRELNIPEPDVNLGCGGGTQAEQTAAIMVAFEKELLANPADLVMVVGDVTSTMACSIVAKKLHTKVAHVEAGIRSNDLTMPEEINRMVTDCLADYFFTTTLDAGENLKKLGIPEDRIFFVGNVMIDTLLSNQARFKKPAIWDQLELEQGNYLVMTLHRPANVDEESKFRALLEAIIKNSNGLPVIFPVHPRAAKIIQSLSLKVSKSLHLIDPLGYLEFNYLVQHAKAVITDSGGITEETTIMGIPCLTLRDNTERPETITIGTNELIGTNPDGIKPALDKLFAGKWKKGSIPNLWDGKTAERIVARLIELYGS